MSKLSPMTHRIEILSDCSQFQEILHGKIEANGVLDYPPTADPQAIAELLALTYGADAAEVIAIPLPYRYYL